MNNLCRARILSLSLALTASAAMAAAPVLHLAFEEEAGDVVTDASEFGNDGAIVGAVARVDGRFGRAIELAGGGYVDLVEIPAYDVTSAITVVMWMATDVVTTWARILDKSQWQDNGFDVALSQVTHAPLIEFFVDNTTTQALATTPADDGQWHHIAGSFGAKTLKIYVDGVMEQSVGSTGDVDIKPNDWPIRLGREANAAMGQQYVGKLDEVAVYDVELSEAEILDIYENGIPSALAVAARDKLAVIWATLR
jgi:hypothetical protein